MADRPRLLLVPSLTELEWTIRPLLGEWADVASYDAPGVGDEPAAEGSPFAARAGRGLAEIERRGWERCVVVADELACPAAILLAKERPEAVRGLVLGHPIVSFEFTTERRPFNQAVVEAHVQLAEASHRAFVLEQFRSWTGLYGQSAPDARELADQFLARVPHAVATSFYAGLMANGQHYQKEIRAALDSLPPVPKLLVQHEDCVMFTREGFEDAVAALPDAATAGTSTKPSADPAFDDILRTFVAGLPE